MRLVPVLRKFSRQFEDGRVPAYSLFLSGIAGWREFRVGPVASGFRLTFLQLHLGALGGRVMTAGRSVAGWQRSGNWRDAGLIQGCTVSPARGFTVGSAERALKGVERVPRRKRLGAALRGRSGDRSVAGGAPELRNCNLESAVHSPDGSASSPKTAWSDHSQEMGCPRLADGSPDECLPFACRRVPSGVLV